MINMRLKVLSLILCILLVLPLTACGSKTDDTTAKAGESSTNSSVDSSVSDDSGASQESSLTDTDNENSNFVSSSTIQTGANTVNQEKNNPVSQNQPKQTTVESKQSTNNNVSVQNVTSKTDTSKPPTVIAVEKIALNTSSATLKIGDTLNLNAVITPSNATDKATAWSTSNASVTVSNGIVTAKSAGTATVTAVCGGKSASCTITVNAPVSELNADYYVTYANEYGRDTIGLIYDTSIGNGNWNAPVNLKTTLSDENMKQGIRSAIERVKYDGAVAFYAYADPQANGSCKLYIYYG